jgi:anti-anti-sigma factor
METSQIAVDRDDGVGVVSVHGEHDLNTSDPLADRLSKLLDEGLPVVCDLTAATFIDSSILRVILDARRRAHEGGIGFAVAAGEGTGEGVLRVLEVTGLSTTLPVASSRDEAMKQAIAGPPS